MVLRIEKVGNRLYNKNIQKEAFGMFYSFSGNEIKPEGWLKAQLITQAKGLSGNLDKIWPDVRDSAWIGGKCEGWERVPYWLDGFIPLAYILEDKDMIARADKYINSIIDRQQPDGWLCPCSEEQRKTYDVWAFFLIGKVLALYCDFTASKRAEDALYKGMKCLYDLLSNGNIRLHTWGEYRWFECMIPLEFLHRKYKEEWIKELARILRQQGADYPSFADSWKKPLNKWTLYTHIVNLCMMLKYEAVSHSLLGEDYTDIAEKLWRELEKYNGTAVGTFTGDECLSGRANNQGTELCSVAELMYSCELLYRLTGKSVWAKRLEKAAFNALPAAISEDMWSHQYDQMVNQIACVRFPGRPIFRTNNSEAHLFGLEPHFGCCTANFNQAWPKLCMNVFLKTKGGILCALPLPATLNTNIKGAEVTVKNDSCYPFKNSLKITVSVSKPTVFTLKVRIPDWAKNITLNGNAVKKSGYITVNKLWQGSESLDISFSDTPHIVTRPNGLKTVEYGALVFSLPISYTEKAYEYEKDGVLRKAPYCDYELYPTSEWRYGLASDEFTVCEKEIASPAFSFKDPPVTLKAKVARVDWDFEDGFETVSAKKPDSNKALSAAEDIELIPYGCAKLRITEMPKVKQGG